MEFRLLFASKQTSVPRQISESQTPNDVLENLHSDRMEQPVAVTCNADAIERVADNGG